MPEVKVPELAESITEGTIAEWLKSVGDSVDKGEAIVELETDKVNVEVVSEDAGVLQETLFDEGDTVEVGQAIAVVGEGQPSNSGSSSSDDSKQESKSDDAKSSDDSKDTQTQDDSSDQSGQRVNATPSARRYAREQGIDLSELAGKSGDVVRKEDVDSKQNQPSGSSSQSSSSKEDSKPAQSSKPSKPVVREKCHVVRKQLLRNF